MKNLLSDKTPQATYGGNTIGGSTVRGLLGAFCFKEGIMDTQKPKEDSRLGKDLDKEQLPCIISKVDAVAQALLLAYASPGDIVDEEQFHRGLHWTLDDAVSELKAISENFCEDASESPRVAAL